MTLTRTQRRNLTKLADYLEGLPKGYRHFDMFDFITPSDEADESVITHYALHNGGVASCGTVACALGHGPAAGVLFRREELSFGAPDWWRYAKRFVEDDECPEFDWAFGSEWRDVDNHHWGAAARIRYLLKHGAPEGFKYGDASRSHRRLYREFDKRYAQVSA